jgi:hypothetical protein
MPRKETSHDPRLVARENPRRDRRVLVLAALAGAVLTAIGLRFVIVPEDAARFFGLTGRPTGYQLHTVVGLRDLWLGLLVIAFVWLAEWRALTLWFALAALVCFGDAGIVAGAGGPALAIAFHSVSGVICAVLAALAFRRANRDPTAWPSA